ncbi:MAG: segregation/condensation protein A [Actinobacteria bacterium]|nr:segregation/condensation protein A [Actinomycetota bacterium]MCL5445878.1 segregation/condensation protein A [Actinomycetota bacterium]
MDELDTTIQAGPVSPTFGRGGDRIEHNIHNTVATGGVSTVDEVCGSSERSAEAASGGTHEGTAWNLRNPRRKRSGMETGGSLEDGQSEKVTEGPLEVLARIVAEHPADLYDIPLSDLVDSFMAEMSGVFHNSGSDEAAGDGTRTGQRIGPLDIDRLSEFLLLASTLLEWKSRLLLASDDVPDLDEELYALEERDKLIGRFMELQVYAQVAQSLSIMMERAALSIPRSAGLEERFATLAPDLLAGVDAGTLCSVFAEIQERASSAGVEINHVTVDKVSVAETLRALRHRLKVLRRTTFRDLTGHLNERMDIIVHFLAILELYKRGMVALSQAETFGDLDIEWIATDGSPTDGSGAEMDDGYGG